MELAEENKEWGCRENTRSQLAPKDTTKTALADVIDCLHTLVTLSDMVVASLTGQQIECTSHYMSPGVCDSTPHYTNASGLVR